MADGQEIELKFEVEPASLKRLEQKLIVRRGGKPAEPQHLLSVEAV